MSLQARLLEWFQKNQRPLPWRVHYRPYEVWISEIMLQQTQMKTVLPYYERWMRLFPDVETLAKSDSKEVLKAWEGLGYYSRARNLHETAKLLADRHGGRFPSDFETIRGLKGIGRYSAGAIASIAFNQERPIVDGNVLRVLSRVYAIKKPIDVEKNKPLFWELQEKLIPKGKARWFNQALMELGALVCATENPSCPLCPLRDFCKAYKNGNPEDYPVRAKRKKSVKVTAGALILESKSRYLIRLRPLGEIMGGLWEFPEWKLAKNKEMSRVAVERKTKKLIERDFNIDTDHLKYLGALKRNYTHFNETLHTFQLSLPAPALKNISGPKPKPPGGAGGEASAARSEELHEERRSPAGDRTRTPTPVWATKKDFSKYPFSSAHAKIVKLIQGRSVS